MDFTGQGEIAVSSTPDVVLFSAPRQVQLPSMVVLHQEAPATEDPYPYMALKVSTTSYTGEVEASNIYYSFNHIVGFLDPLGTSATLWPQSQSVVVPPDMTGIVYLLVSLYPFTDITLEFAEELPSAENHRFIRPIANVTTNTEGAVTRLRQRFFGMLVIPSEQVNPDIEGGILV